MARPKGPAREPVHVKFDKDIGLTLKKKIPGLRRSKFVSDAVRQKMLQEGIVLVRTA